MQRVDCFVCVCVCVCVSTIIMSRSSYQRGIPSPVRSDYFSSGPKDSGGSDFDDVHLSSNPATYLGSVAQLALFPFLAKFLLTTFSWWGN